MISILHPSRSRPERSFNTIDKWMNRSTSGLQVIVSVDSDDPKLDEYTKYFGPENDLRLPYDFIVNDNRSAVDAINNAAKIATGDILIVVSDDTDCPVAWNLQLSKALSGKQDFIVKCPDGIQSWIITMPIMDRKYYERFGYIYHPDYKHMFVDLELTCVADLLQKKIDLPIPFPHLHYSIGASQKDLLSERADATWAQGEETFLSRLKNNFDIRPEEITGKITDESYRAWIATKIPSLRL